MSPPPDARAAGLSIVAKAMPPFIRVQHPVAAVTDAFQREGFRTPHFEPPGFAELLFDLAPRSYDDSRTAAIPGASEAGFWRRRPGAWPQRATRHNRPPPFI